MWGAACRLDPSKCRRDSCMYPSICKGFSVDQRACIELLRDVQATPGVKHVRVASGVRFDLALKDATALAAYTGEFTGGQLKIAPEHCVPDVLDLMRKPGMKPFEAFLEAFVRYSEAHGKEQYVIPYLMSAFPGCTDAHMRQLGDWLAARNWSPRQVQCFIPTPGTVATAMYYARCTPDGAPIYVAIEIGKGDFLFGSANSFKQALDGSGIANEYITRDGIHDWAFWKGCLPKLLKKVSDTFEE